MADKKDDHSTARSIGQGARAVLSIARHALAPGAIVADAAKGLYDTVAPGIPAFVEGLTGQAPGAISAPAVNRLAPAKPAAVKAGPERKPIPITPEMRMMAHIDAMLSQPHTQAQETQAMGLLAASRARPATGANAVSEAGARYSTQLLEMQLAAAETARKAGDTDQALELGQKALQDHISRLATFARGNPADLAQAGLLQAQE